MPVRGIRGATVAAANIPDSIRSATRELLLALAAANRLDPADIASILFSATPDLTAEAPARAARQMGWTEAAMLCLGEMDVVNGLKRCIRVLIHWNTDKGVDEIRHVYLYEAAQLRPDRAALTRDPDP